MTTNRLYNRYVAQLSAQFGQYKEAETKLIKYLETKPSLINQHLTYNDLLLYTYRQFDEDEDAINRSLKYALEHINILPELIDNFEKHDYDFENEYIVSVDIALIIYKHKKEKEKIMDLCKLLAKIYKRNKKKRHNFASIAYEISHHGIYEDINLKGEYDKVFNQLRKTMEKPKNF